MTDLTDTGLGTDDVEGIVHNENDFLDETAPETDYFKMMMADNEAGTRGGAANGAGGGGGPNPFNDGNNYDGTDGDSVLGGATLASMLQNNPPNDDDSNANNYLKNYDAMSVDSYGYSLAKSNTLPTAGLGGAGSGLVIANGNGDIEIEHDNVNGAAIVGGGGRGVVDVERTTMENIAIVGVDPDDDVSTIANDTVNQDTKAFFSAGAGQSAKSSTPRIRLFKEYMTPEKQKKGQNKNKSPDGDDIKDDDTAPETPPGMTIRVPASGGSSTGKQKKKTARGTSVRKTGGSGSGGSSTSKMSIGAGGSASTSDDKKSDEDFEPSSSRSTTTRSRRIYIVAGVLAVILFASIIALVVALSSVRKDDDGNNASSLLTNNSTSSGPEDSNVDQDSNVLDDWPDLGDGVLEIEETPVPVPVPAPIDQEVVPVPIAPPVQTPVVVTTPTLPAPTVQTSVPAVIFQDMITVLDSRGVGTDFQDSETSPQFQALQWLSNDPAFYTYSEDRQVQRWVLAVLGYSLDPTTDIFGRRKLQIDGWLSYTDECTWLTTSIGVNACDTNGMYQTIDIQDMNLSGALPSELGLLSGSLRSINLSVNNIQGQIPSELGNLSLLDSLRLRRNSIEGTIPDDIGRLNFIELLDFGVNKLTGAIPDSIGRMDSLAVLNLDYNKLDGELPREIGDLSNTLVELKVNNNFLTGELPNELSRLDQLEILMIGGNNFEGEMPRNVCRDLDQLVLVSVDCQSQGECDCCTECTTTSEPTPTPPTEAPVCSDTVSVSGTCLEPGDEIGVGFSNCNAQEDDWIGIYRADQDTSSLPNPAVWSWACGSRTCREAVGSNNFGLDERHAGDGAWPLDEGEYVVVLARNSARPYQAYGRSQSFTIQDNC
eukprot:CAMPEP_0113494618 /NCGR_PEP_ID=MMETSP0014_2-20120614/29196_1 /TAXON_ID=2857 /ORGANISM="Nitzschia sp." /LENGTH=878 /DNA_ID=CAMNT_0000388509 /DNA_START=50 /DNA_END=2686 /DNA_ORIENTATION=+ /assembly_acc=CAM_ASM_000159